VFRHVLGSYEDRQKTLLLENGDLRSALLDLQKDLITMLHSDNGRPADRSSTEVCVLSSCDCRFIAAENVECWPYMYRYCMKLITSLCYIDQDNSVFHVWILNKICTRMNIDMISTYFSTTKQICYIGFCE